jgi:hypothetical protein
MYNILANSVISENFVKDKDKNKALAYWKEMMPFATIRAVRTIVGKFSDNTINKEKRDSK